MPIDLTDAELATAAQACRAMAYQEGERAKKTENPTVRGPIENAAKRYGPGAEARAGTEGAGVKSTPSPGSSTRETVVERPQSEMLCKFCNEERPLINAHIVPEAFFRDMKSSDEAMLYLLSSNAEKRPKRTPIGPYDPGILCRSCEEQFQEWDDYGAKLLIADRDTAFRKISVAEFDVFVADEFDYTKLKLFLISVVWRAAVATHPTFNKVSLGPRVNRAKQLIEARDAGVPSEFPFVLSRLIPSPGVQLAPKFAAPPISRRYPGGCHAVKLYLGSFLADVCTGRNPFPPALGQVIVSPGLPAYAVGLRAGEVDDLKAFRKAILMHGPRLFAKDRLKRE
jgi:hypothetical protein